MSTNGWAAIPNDVARDPNLHYGAKALFMALASHAREDGRAWPSTETLAGEVGMSTPTVKRHLTALRDRGLIDWEVRPTASGRQRFFTVWRPDGRITKGRRSDHEEPEGSDHERPPNKNHENNNHGTTPDADASGEVFVLISEDDVEPAKPAPNAGHLVAAWCESWSNANGGQQPHPSLLPRVRGIMKNVAKHCQTYDDWRAAWEASKVAGARGVYDVVGLLADRRRGERGAGYGSVLPTIQSTINGANGVYVDPWTDSGLDSPLSGGPLPLNPPANLRIS